MTEGDDERSMRHDAKELVRQHGGASMARENNEKASDKLGEDSRNG